MKLVAILFMLIMSIGCSDKTTSTDSESDINSESDLNTNTDTNTYVNISDTIALNETGGVNDSDFDPSIDPGINPIFLTDPELNQTEDYVYKETKPGDHDLPGGIAAISYDVAGEDNLLTVLSLHVDELKKDSGLALYLENGTALNDDDLYFLQRLNLSENGWTGLKNLNTLYVYNLKTLQGGVESTTETAYGIPYPFLWKNGWQSPKSEILKDSCWVEHIVMDDLEEIAAGTFCDTYFHSMSFKGVKMVREMGLGFAPRAPATYLYMPSLIEAEMHAFRRRQRILKYNFPKLTKLGPFAIDDNSRMQYINAPSLINTATDDVDDRRNTFNDPRDLIDFNFEKIEYLGLSCMGGTNKTTTVFRFPSMINFDGSSLRGHTNMKYLWAPKATRFGPNLFIGDTSLTTIYAPKVEDVGRFAFQNCTSLKELELPSATIIRINAFDSASSLEEVRLPVVETIQDEVFKDLPNLKRVYLGDTPPEQGTDVFTGTSSDLIIFYTGEESDWASWKPVGNDKAQVIKEE